MTAKIVALCNQKGGVGKTTTAFHLARAAVLDGKRVLLIDADPQGNLTSVAAAEPVDEDQAGLADVLSDKTSDTIRDVAVAGIWPGVDLIPTAGATLGAVRDELIIAGAGREFRLKKALAAVVDDYDLVLIDCAPSLDQLAINALVAAHGALVVTEAKLFAANGLGALLQTIAAVRDFYNPALKVTGVLVNRLEERTVSSAAWLDELREAAAGNGLTLLPPIPKRVVIADAAEAARGLDEWGTADAAAVGTIYTDHLHAIEGALS
ncbi:ParA family protein [Tessaracoccus flavescens]|uniref:Cobalamin biosynthesis protein CobQ n=1 Tax=Tessaracoccus flavescens TaxID=399497 RepID=A0A1Q2D2W3_9ACTN|nr:ParA family protein [Tessaracoccus flavescens]AQP52722.1 cobalamin biosynthesis protein CobQ [Tessaracoccus flavescens]